MTASIHRLTAGSGYDYLTRHVAVMDATEKGHLGLASYYTERGETPGVWVGSGMAGIDGLEVGDAVTADHMQALFGSGHHPLANERAHELDLRIGRPGVPTPTEQDYKNATRLGAPYRVYQGDVSEFRKEVAKRFSAFNEADGLPQDWAIPADERARIRTEVGREFFVREHGREPADARELAALIAKHSRPKTNAVAGFDMTFSPVKSVSTLWAVADQKTAATIEHAHQAAVRDALAFLESKALYTRLGTNGVRQVDVRGLVATAFTHRDSRAGDPDLHTHVAIANKVQTLDGKWRAIDSRVLYKATVAISETYNTALERHLIDRLGVRFAERPNPDARKRPVREIVGVDAALNQRFSKRRASVEAARKVLATQFQATHGRPPTPVETLQLAQQATLETRQKKHEPRTLAEQREAWDREAIEALGSARRLRQMIHGALNPASAARTLADSAWFTGATDRVLTAMEGGRATWQYWHVDAEAQRQVRGADVPTNQVDNVVNLLVGEVLQIRSVSLARPGEEITEPAELRRTDGSSVYTQAGSTLYTSAKILNAEQQLVDLAGRRDGQRVDAAQVDIALLESTANGRTLNPGQATLVRAMATSGARLQLALAPAGAGKTTAMRALTRAWVGDGRTVVGLAPSASAATVLGAEIGVHTDTLAKLTWNLSNGGALPDWATDIDSGTLVVIDEAGMADTLSLAAAAQFVIDRGGSVRLIGDDQQLAAIGAGGVLRDIQVTHDALQLTELVRFKDPAEGAATLALREGRPEALGFYLDHQRVHVGDLATMTDEVFTNWQADRDAGMDALMLAPTRELVSELNQRARTHRLSLVDPADPATHGPTRTLADGNQASVGDLIITRSNDRRLRVSATDWVKNGDRWTIRSIDARTGALTVQNTRHRRTVRLPAEYVTAFTELGYACTTHSAQGVTASSTHGLATGRESRQQLYTMASRSESANHIYLELAGDGDPHSIIRPEMVHPQTAVDILEAILARDDSPRSATSLLRESADPRTRLGEATPQYLDSLYLAAEHFLGVEVANGLDEAADTLLPGLVDEPAWPALRAHLLLLGAHGRDPVTELRTAANQRELDTAVDRAAVLDWRLDSTGLRNAGPGPLPWVPGIPAALAADPHWSGMLAQRADLVAGLAAEVREHTTATDDLPVWARNGIQHDPATLADVEVWRAAMQVASDDRRPTGPAQLQKAAATWQRQLNRRVAGTHTPALKEWSNLLTELAPAVRGDDFTPLLAERLAAMARAGVAAHQLLRGAVATGPLPDEHAAAALWWRMSRHLTPAVADQVSSRDHVSADWAPQLAEALGADRVQRLQTSSWWPALVSNIDHGLQRGWTVAGLLGDLTATAADIEDCQALVWRTSIALEPIPADGDQPDHLEQPPADMWDGYEPASDPSAAAPVADPAAAADAALTDEAWAIPDVLRVPVDQLAEPPEDDPWPEHDPWSEEPGEDRSAPAATTAATAPAVASTRGRDATADLAVQQDLDRAGHARMVAGIRTEPIDIDLHPAFARVAELRDSPVSRERMLEVNHLAQQFFETHLGSSWARSYLARRFGVDLAGHRHFQPGHAPAGWNNLVKHLRARGVTDAEMLAVDVARTASTGRLIDTFRDRVTFPIIHRGEILGFVARRNPDKTDDDRAGPKYLNTRNTPLFHKGDQLYGVIDELIDAGATPSLVEGPTDAIAVTLASAGQYMGVTSLGTSLTTDQAAQLARIGRNPIVARDGDPEGQKAAERDFWMLAPHGLDPAYAAMPDGADPSSMLEDGVPALLVTELAAAQPLADHLLLERLGNLPAHQARVAAAQILAARPSHTWAPGVEQISSRLWVSQELMRRDLRAAVHTWDSDTRRESQQRTSEIADVGARMKAAATAAPEQRWAVLAGDLDLRLTAQPDWPETARALQDAHDRGHDVAFVARAAVAAAPLGAQPARDLLNRLTRLNLTAGGETGSDSPATRPTGPPEEGVAPPAVASPGAARERQQVPQRPAGGNNPRR